LTSFSDDSVTVKTCLMGWCPTYNVQSSGTLCRNWLTPIDNQTCGEEGVYAVYDQVVIPEADVRDGWSWLVKDDGSSGSSSSQSSSGGGYRMTHGVTYSMMGALFGTAVGVGYAAKKKLICTDEDE
jgi:hypothetical protein